MQSSTRKTIAAESLPLVTLINSRGCALLSVTPAQGPWSWANGMERITYCQSQPSAHLSQLLLYEDPRGALAFQPGVYLCAHTMLMRGWLSLRW